MQSQQQSLNPEVQAVLDLCEIQGVPITYDKGLFKIEKISPWNNTLLNIRNLHPLAKPAFTQNVHTVIRWIDEWKLWNPK